MKIESTHTFFGKKTTFTCDAKCEKAWGINARPKAQITENEDDFEYLADDELEVAPKVSGNTEGGQDKWCIRECERCSRLGCQEKDFSKRLKNIKS